MPDNLLFIFSDQQRAGEMGCEGNEQARTPHLDRMAEEGIRFTNAVSTCPVCTPYRASLLTGKYPLTNGMIVNDIRLPTTETTIAHVMQAAGYQTIYLGKWHLDGPYRGGWTPPGPRRQGFEIWAASECCHDYMKAWHYRDTPDPLWIDGYEPDYYTDVAIEYLFSWARLAPSRRRPFCLFLSYSPPHNPYDQLPDAYKIHNPQAMDLRPNVPAQDAEIARWQYAGYHNHLTALDRNVGRLRAALEEIGIVQKTLVIYTSDHGDMLRSHGLYEKQWPYEESIAVPFIACQPGRLPQGRVCDVLLNTPDIMPTLLGYLGLTCPPSVEGQDLSWALRGESGPEPVSAFLAVPVPFLPGHIVPEWRGVRTKTHIYVETRHGPWLLFDNVADPFQTNNLVAKPAAAPLRAKLAANLHQWLKHLHDEFLPREAYVERFGLQLAPNGHPIYFTEVGRHDPAE